MELKHPDVLMSPAEAAAYLGLSTGTVNNDRYGKRRIPYHKVLAKVVYKKSELDAMVIAQAVPGK